MNARPHAGPLAQEREKRPPSLEESEPAVSPAPRSSRREDALINSDFSQSLLTSAATIHDNAAPVSLVSGERAGAMAGVTSKIEFSLATEADDPGIRRLLRENPMAGQISLSLEREPDYFTEARHSGARHQTIVACDRGGIVCVGTCSFRQRFVNGAPRRVGYLGGLRLDARLGGRFDILRRGYRFFHDLQRANPADFYFTAVAADNERARQFLERSLPGMPRYECLGDFVTMLVPVPRGWKAAAGETPATIVEEPLTVLREHNRRYQFSPCWTTKELQALHLLGLRLDDFRVARHQGEPVACAALWDQRSFKQTVIRAYAVPLSWARPWINLAARLWGRPGLPEAGSTLAHAAVSHLAAPVNQPEMIAGLICSLFPLARTKGIEWLTLGFAAADPRLAALRDRIAAREYRSRLYRVRWPDLPDDALDDCLPGPEIALL